MVNERSYIEKAESSFIGVNELDLLEVIVGPELNDFQKSHMELVELKLGCQTTKKRLHWVILDWFEAYY